MRRIGCVNKENGFGLGAPGTISAELFVKVIHWQVPGTWYLVNGFEALNLRIHNDT